MAENIGRINQLTQADEVHKAHNESEKLTPMRLLALESGGDWYDASVEYLLIPENTDVEKEFKRWREWYRTKYTAPNARIEYISFEQWLKSLGAKNATEKDIVVFHEDY